MATITHHGGTRGVTGSCHRLTFDDGQAVLIDCGISLKELERRASSIDFDLGVLTAILITHEHDDHIGIADA